MFWVVTIIIILLVLLVVILSNLDIFLQVTKWMFIFWLMVGGVNLFMEPRLSFSEWLIGGGVGSLLVAIGLTVFFALFGWGLESAGNMAEEHEWKQEKLQELEDAHRRHRRKEPYMPLVRGEVVEENPRQIPARVPIKAKGRLEQWENQVDPRLVEEAKKAWYWGHTWKAMSIEYMECPKCKRVTPHYMYFNSAKCAWHV